MPLFSNLVKKSLFELILELANSEENSESSSSKNQKVVLALYDALNSRDVDTVKKIVATDLEWWFHGPPSHQFLMRLLTGVEEESNSFFKFVPSDITCFGSLVIAEGRDKFRSISWIHVWTVTDGVITQVKEYFNTSLTVTRLGKEAQTSKSKSPSSTAEITPVHCPSVWESTFSNLDGKSLPGLVLAI
ncbi:hypothetical protein K2173_002974 [Erythroxylum novogranatense]|uniref:Wound-induced protein 1 n=1 Tax=Erythroxylum novogranatense TaxID=1862640 RepID=A0AAV8TUA2_9ROSI|nr:hypothetical protein K2173_002974 [Erythroxylum novogranatense]